MTLVAALEPGSLAAQVMIIEDFINFYCASRIRSQTSSSQRTRYKTCKVPKRDGKHMRLAARHIGTVKSPCDNDSSETISPSARSPGVPWRLRSGLASLFRYGTSCLNSPDFAPAVVPDILPLLDLECAADRTGTVRGRRYGQPSRVLTGATKDRVCPEYWSLHVKVTFERCGLFCG
jgi:hypothetical protein